MKKKYILQFINFCVCVVILCLSLSSCSKEESVTGKGFGNGSAALLINVGDMTEPETVSVSKSQSEAETLTARVNENYMMKCTLRRTSASSTKAANPLATGVYYRLIAYNGTDASVVSAGNYAGSTVFKVGSESSSHLTLPAGNYYFVAYSYNQTSTISDGFDGTLTALSPIAPPTDVLWFGKAVTLVDGDNNLTINFKHAFSQVQASMDISAVGTSLSACSAQLTPGSDASISLATGALTAGSNSIAQNFSWTNPSGTSSLSDKAVVYTAGNAPTITFPTGSISLVKNSVSISNTAAISLAFSTVLQPGYTYTLNCVLQDTPTLNIVVASDINNTYGYSIARTAGGAAKVFSSTNNFGPAGIVHTNGYNYITPNSYVNAFATGTDTYKWLTGIGNNGKIADIVYIAFYSAYGTPNQEASASLLTGYLDKGGVVVAFLDNADEGNLIAPYLANDVMGQTTITASSVYSAGAVYGFPAQGLSGSAYTSAMTQYANDPIVNGPFGDLRDKQWGEDASSTVGFNNLPVSDPNLTVYSHGINLSTGSTTHSTKAVAFKYESATRNIVVFGDGGLMSSENGTSTSTHTTICPFYWNTTTMYPVFKPNYGNGSTKYSVYNSVVFCNIMAWAIKKSVSLKSKRDSYIMP